MRLAAAALLTMGFLGCDDDSGVRFEGTRGFEEGGGDGAVGGGGEGEGGNQNAGIVGSCDQRENDGPCVLYVGFKWEQGEASKECATRPGEFFPNEECPVKDLIGRCSLDVQGAFGIIEYYYEPQFSAVDVPTLNLQCEIGGGVWTTAELGKS